jgi:hypothetical protein
MINIRCGLFETNSSSTHSLIIMTKGQYEKVRNTEDLYFSCNYDDVTKPEDIVFKTKQEIIDKYDINSDYIDDVIAGYDFYTLDTLDDALIAEVDDLVIISSYSYD